MTARLKEKYINEIRPKIKSEFGVKNDMAIGKLLKICLNSCAGAGVKTQDRKLLEMTQRDMTLIAGQKAVIVNAKRSVSNFKLRQGYPLAARVTLRGDRMYEFLDRMITIALPRLRDFRGLNPDSFDGRGNYSMGITEQTIFPEIDLDSVSYVFGMDVNIVTSSNDDAMARAILTQLGMPFRKK